VLLPQFATKRKKQRKLFLTKPILNLSS